MAAPTRSRGLRSIGNKMLAVLVTVAVVPAVAVSLYALRKASDALSEQALTLISETTTTDARRIEAQLDAVQQGMDTVKENSDLVRFLFNLYPDAASRESGEASPLDDDAWNKLNREAATVDQKLRSLLDQQPSCTLAFVISHGFLVKGGTPVVWLEREGDEVRPRTLLRRDEQRFLRPPSSPLDETIARKLTEAREEHPTRDVLRATVVQPEASGGEALEIFAASVNGFEVGDFHEYGWIVLVHSWRAILQQLHGAGISSAAEPGVITVYFGDRLLPLATSRPGTFAKLPEEFGLRKHARGGHANAALLKTGEIVAFAPLTPQREDPSVRHVLAIERPARELLDSVAGFRFVFAEVLAAALLLATLIGIGISRRLTRPLQVLRDGAIQIGRGDLQQRLDVPTGDEVEEVAREFNAMAAQLRSLYGGMETTIRERTEQLQSALDDLRRAHDQIVESEKRYSDIVENASDLIQVTDGQGRIVSANRRQTELFGIAVDALRGRSFLDFVAPDARAATGRGFDHVLAGGTLRAFASELLADGGRGVPVEISATPVVEDGRPVGVRAILRDVSERRAIEARLIKAERLSSIGSLAAGVAHEINNPLGIITMFAQRTLELARKGQIDLGKLEKIVEQGKRVAGITRNLLDFARAAPTRFAPFAIAEAIQSTCMLVADRAMSAAIRIVQEIAPDLPPVHGNSQQISQVLLNLLLNAFQAIGKDGTVTVRAALTTSSRLPMASSALRVTVEDSGPGIPADVLPRLFEPFFTTKAPGEGTGLGLSVSYGILKEHHGAIFADNLPGGGARFEFELPLDVSAGASSEPKSPISARRS